MSVAAMFGLQLLEQSLLAVAALSLLCGVLSLVVNRRRSMTRRGSSRSVRRVNRILRDASEGATDERLRLGRMTRFHVMHDALMNRRLRRALGRDQLHRATLVRSFAECQAEMIRASQELRLLTDARQKLHDSKPSTLSPRQIKWFNAALIAGDLAIVGGALISNDRDLTVEMAYLSAAAAAFSLWFAGKLAGGLIGDRLEQNRKPRSVDRVDSDHVEPHRFASIDTVVIAASIIMIIGTAVALGLLRETKIGVWIILSAVPAFGSMALSILTKSDALHGLNTSFEHYNNSRRRLRRALKRVADELGKARRLRVLSGTLVTAKLTMLERAVAAETGHLVGAEAAQEANILSLDDLLNSIGVLRARLSGPTTNSDERQEFEDIEAAIAGLWNGLRQVRIFDHAAPTPTNINNGRSPTVAPNPVVAPGPAAAPNLEPIQ